MLFLTAFIQAEPVGNIPGYDRFVLFQYKTTEKCFPDFGWDGQGDIYLYFWTDRVLDIVDGKGHLVRRLSPPTSFYSTNLSVDQEGRFVCYPTSKESGGSYVFDKDGTYLDAFDGIGKQDTGGLVFDHGVLTVAKTGHEIWRAKGSEGKMALPSLDRFAVSRQIPDQMAVTLDGKAYTVPMARPWSFTGAKSFDEEGNLYLMFERLVVPDRLNPVMGWVFRVKVPIDSDLKCAPIPIECAQ